MLVKGIVSQFGKIVATAAKDVINLHREGEVETEPSLTDRLAAHIEIRAKDISGVKIIIRTLRDMGPGAPEAEFGADICGVLNVKMKGYSVSKGFLAQAKSDGNGIQVMPGYHGVRPVEVGSKSKADKLRIQCGKMLKVTPDSFVFVYSPTGIVVTPAVSVTALSGSGQIYSKSVEGFFKEFLMCFIGDPRLNAHDDSTLRTIRDRLNARLALLIAIEEP